MSVFLGMLEVFGLMIAALIMCVLFYMTLRVLFEIVIRGLMNKLEEAKYRKFSNKRRMTYR